MGLFWGKKLPVPRQDYNICGLCQEHWDNYVARSLYLPGDIEKLFRIVPCEDGCEMCVEENHHKQKVAKAVDEAWERFK